MRRITRKQILARLFIGFFTAASLLCTVNSAVAGGPRYTYGKYYITKGDTRYEYNFDELSGIKLTDPASNNIVEVTITGSDSPTTEIFSGYTDSSYRTSNNSLKITTNEGAATKLGTVYGGYTEDGNANSNTVEITNSKTGTVWGGHIASESSTVNTTNLNTLRLTNCEINAGNIVAAKNYGAGNAVENTVEVSGGIVKSDLISGAQLLSGNAILNKVTISDLDSPATYTYIVGGTVTDGNAYSNAVTLDNLKELNGTLVAGGYVATGEAATNTVTINNSSVKGQIYGGYVQNDDNATGNTVEISDGSTISGYVYGGYIGTGSATLNEVHITDSTTGTVYGGQVNNTGSAAENKVHIASSTISGLVYGGYIGNDGNTTGNTVEISDGSTISGYVYGGYIGTGSATLNKVHVTDSTTSAVFGGYVVGTGTGSATLNEVRVTDSTTGAVYGGQVKNTGSAAENKVYIASSTTKSAVFGGYVNATGSATRNIVKITSASKLNNVVSGGYVGTGTASLNEVTIDNSEITGFVYGGYVNATGTAMLNKIDVIANSNVNSIYGGWVKNGSAASNTVTISDSNTKSLYGGYVSNIGSATQNIVEISDGSTIEKDVYGGYVNNNGNATGNTVEISGGSSVESDVYGGYVKNNGNATDNTVEISGGSSVNGSVYGGYVKVADDANDAKTGNKLIISGAGNTIGGQIVNFETMTFDASDVKKDETMLSLTTEESFPIDVKSIETNNANLAVGEKITLISSAVDNTYDGNITYKIDGKQAIKDGNKFIANIAKEDSDKVVHVNEYAYEYNINDYKLNLCNNSGFITGLYNFDAEGAKQTLGQAEMTVSSVPENVTEIYGAYSEDAEVTAGGATINLETTELSDVDLIGSYNLKDETKVDTTKNTLNVNVSGVKVKSVEGFGNLNFKLALDEKAMLDISDSYDMNGVTFNSILPEDGFVGTQTILKTGSLTNDSSAKFKINDAELNSTRTLTITTKNTDSVVYGTYTYGINSEIITLTGKSIVSAVNINSGETQATDNNTLKVTGNMAEKYTELYGAFNADGGAATNATVELSEAVSNENLTIYGGYSTDSGVDVTTGNTLKVSKNGNKIKNILNFSKLDFSLDSDNSNNPTMLSLAADTVDLSKASINVNLTNALAEGQTVTLLGAAQQLSLANDKLTINNEKLDSDLSLKIVDDSSKKYVNVGGYSLNNASGKLSITADESFITSKYINGDKSKSVEKLVLTSELSGFKEIYGSYSADNSVAEGGTISINEKVDMSQTTLIGGKATGNGTVGKNTLEISSAAAGSKVNGVSKFSDVNVKLDNAIAEGQTVTLLEANKLELTDSVFTINNKALDSNLSLKFADDSTKKYVSIGEYNLKNSDNKLSISAKESLLTSRYRNGAEDLSVEKFELTDELNKFKAIYGSYSADNSAAEGGKLFINEAVNLSETTLIGGKSAGNGEVKNNTLEISSAAAGSKVKGAEKFDNFKFTLAAGMSGSTPMLSTTDKILLDGATIDTDLSNLDAADDTKLVLLDNTEGKAAKRLLNGKEGNIINAKKNEGFVAISSVGYSADEDKLAIDVKSEGAAGAFIDKDGNITGKMELTLGDSTASNVRANVRAGFLRASEGSDLSGYKDIYGFYSAGEKDPTGPITVNIVSAIDYRNTVLHGGYRNGNRYAKNTKLVIDSLNVKLKGVTDFETMTFNLPAETKNGDTMLKVADAVDMAQTKTVVEAKKATGLKAGDSVNLIDSEVGIQNFDTKKYTVSGLTDKTGEVKVEDKALVLALDENGEKPNKNTKAPVEGISAAMALVNQASALASDKLNKSMTAAVASANGGSATFASMNGGHSKYETGSYVEADSWNIGFGIAKKGMSSKNPDSTYGLFFQYGKSNFDTHNDGGFRGDGDSKMFGAGLTFHQEARSKFYYHGNIYAGKVDAKWNCSEGGYDDDAAYWGMTFGMGRKHNAGGNKTMDVYGRYSFNHVGSMDGKIGGNEYRFDSTTSHNLRLGLRMEYAQKNAATAYWGLAWEHEFAGDSKATVVKLGRTDSPTLNGNTGIAEVGYEWKRGNWEYNINAEGSFGKRKGVTGSFNINYNF